MNLSISLFLYKGYDIFSSIALQTTLSHTTFCRGLFQICTNYSFSSSLFSSSLPNYWSQTFINALRSYFVLVLKGAYIKYVGGGTGRFYKFFKKYFVAQETMDLNVSWSIIFSENISWPLQSILVSYLRFIFSSISG